MIAPITIPPGVAKNGTEYQNLGRWYDSNLVRWFEGTMRPIGGWVRASETQLAGVARGAIAWRENDFEQRLAIGTTNNLYIFSGGSVYDITPAGLAAGRADSFYGYGYGYGTYNNGNYGESQNLGTSLEATTWSFDTWGERLVAVNTTDGKVYEWANDVTTVAAVIAGAPTGREGLVVTPERILVTFGGKDITWSSAEDNTDWTPTATNSAGSMQLQGNGRIRVAKRVRGQTAFLTETDLHILQYIGQPYIFSLQQIGSFCGIIGPQAASNVEGGLVWMGHSAFYVFDGTLRPIPCDVSDYVFGDLNRLQAPKIHAGHNAQFGEVWWFYPSAASTNIDRYVIWNYRENHWSVGNTLARTAWVDAGVFPYPMAVSNDGYIYEQENGWTNNGAPITTGRYAKSGPVEIANGDTIMHVRQILPDEKSQGQVAFSMRSRYTPQGSETTYGPFTVAPYTDARLSGRQIAMDVEGQADADWRLGRVRLEAVAGGSR